MVSGLARNRMTRITTTGIVDMTFDPNFNSTVFGLARYSDDSMVVVGAFTTGGANFPLLRLAKVTAT